MKKSVFKRTNDDWYPCYVIDHSNIALVEVSIEDIEGRWFIQVRGHDDYGFERSIPDEQTAKFIFDGIISWDYVDMAKLKAIGFRGF